MQVTRKSRLFIRIQNVVFVALFLAAVGLAAWLSTRYVYEADWTAGNRNTLSEASRKLLATIDGPVQITSYAREDGGLREGIEDFIARYRREKPDIALTFVNPDTVPERLRELGITMDGELLIEYQGRREKLQDLSEQALTNALQRIARDKVRWIAFLEGHGERAAHGEANHDLGAFVRELEARGFNVQSLNLARTPAVPDNVAALVIAGPQAQLLPGEVELIRQFVERGGNLLWLGDPDGLYGMEPIAEMLGVRFLPGVVVDPNVRSIGIQDAAMVLVADYRDAQAITRDFSTITLFPWAAGLEVEAPEEWIAESFLTTLPKTWSESGDLEGPIQFDPDSDDRAGPLDIGVALMRQVPADATAQIVKATDAEDAAATAAPDQNQPMRQQRVVVIGDGDFLSNTYLGNGGNLQLGLNIMNWLSHDDQFIDVPAKTAPDLQLNLSRLATAVIGLGFLFGLPVALLGAGLTIWIRRRRR